MAGFPLHHGALAHPNRLKAPLYVQTDFLNLMSTFVSKEPIQITQQGKCYSTITQPHRTSVSHTHETSNGLQGFVMRLKDICFVCNSMGLYTPDQKKAGTSQKSNNYTQAYNRYKQGPILYIQVGRRPPHLAESYFRRAAHVRRKRK